MEIKISKAELVKAITVIETAIPVKTVVDSLRGIKVIAKENKIIFIASKTDMSIKYTSVEGFEIISSGEIVIPGQQFSSIVKKTAEDEFLIKLNEQSNTILLKTSKSKVDFLQYENSSYPEIHFDIDKIESIIITSKDFMDIYIKAKHATAINAVKPIVTGINFAIKNEEMICSATDARRIAIVKKKINSVENKNVTIPKNLFSDIIKVIDALKIGEFESFIDESQFLIKTENAKVKIRLLEGEYPDVDKLISRKKNFNFNIAKKDLSAILEKIILISERDNSNLTMNVNNTNLVLSSYFREIGAMEEFCSIYDIKGTPFTISCNTKFLHEAITAIDSELITIDFVDEISAFNVYGKDQLDNLQVISPIVLN